MKHTPTTWLMMLALLLTAALPAALVAQDQQTQEDPMAALHAYIGVWECEAEWAWGGTMAARNEYTPIFDGKHVRARTWVSDNGGPEYLRYETLFSYNAQAGEYVYTTVAYDGTVQTGTMQRTEAGFLVETENDNGQGGTIKMQQFIAHPEDGAYAWKVSMQNPAGEWVAVMDDQWEKQEDTEDGDAE